MGDVSLVQEGEAVCDRGADTPDLLDCKRLFGVVDCFAQGLARQIRHDDVGASKPAVAVDAAVDIADEVGVLEAKRPDLAFKAHRVVADLAALAAP